MVDISQLLQSSPLDLEPEPEPQRPKAAVPAAQQWVTSRYTIRALAKDGRLVLWNTLRGAISIFKAEQVPQVTQLLNRRDLQGTPEGLLKYLVDRGFKVKQGENEYRQFQYLFGKQHYRSDLLELFLLSSEDCNFRCHYCYEKFARGTMQPWVREAIKRMVEKRAKELQYLFVAWFGGEPLYGWAAMEDLSKAFVELAAKKDISYSSSITTNGYLLTPERSRKLLGWNVRTYQITIDGPPRFHDCSRPGRDGSPTFSTILENLKGLARLEDELDVVLRVNYDLENSPHMGELFDIVRKELGNDTRFRMSFHPVGQWGGDNDANLKVCGRDREEIGAQLRATAFARGVHLSGVRNHNLPGSHVCYAARPHNLVIGADGKVMKCTVKLDEDERNIVGHVTPEGDLKLNSERFALWTEPAFEQDDKCKACFMVPSCQGIHCPLVRMDENRSPCTPTKYGFKRELIEAAEGYGGQRGRHREVPIAR